MATAHGGVAGSEMRERDKVEDLNELRCRSPSAKGVASKGERGQICGPAARRNGAGTTPTETRARNDDGEQDREGERESGGRREGGEEKVGRGHENGKRPIHSPAFPYMAHHELAATAARPTAQPFTAPTAPSAPLAPSALPIVASWGPAPAPRPRNTHRNKAKPAQAQVDRWVVGSLPASSCLALPSPPCTDPRNVGGRQPIRCPTYGASDFRCRYSAQTPAADWPATAETGHRPALQGPCLANSLCCRQRWGAHGFRGAGAAGHSAVRWLFLWKRRGGGSRGKTRNETPCYKQWPMDRHTTAYVCRPFPCCILLGYNAASVSACHCRPARSITC